MALEWTFVAYVLYAEIAVFLLLCIPLPAAWRQALIIKIGRSQLAEKIRPIVALVFCIVGFLFFVAVKEERVTHAEHAHLKNSANPLEYSNNEIRMFRAQRNVYLSGFSLFLLLVLNRFYWIMAQMATAEREKSLSETSRKLAEKQGQTATNALLEADKYKKQVAELQARLEGSSGSGAHGEADKHRQEIQRLKDDLEKARENARNTLAENNSLKKLLAAKGGESEKDK